MATLRPLIAICGTTGVGKSKLAVELALALAQNGETNRHGYSGARIINADAMQVYAGMDVITNKVPVSEQRGVEHLLMGFKQPGEQYIVTQWVRDAINAIEETHTRNQIPIVVGGTSYWLQNLLFSNRLVSFNDASPGIEGQMERPPVSDDVAKSLATLPPEMFDLFHTLPTQAPSAETHPELALSLHQLLSALDPEMGQRRHWRDTRKVLRTLSIIHDTGRRSSEIWAEQAKSAAHPRYRTICFWMYANPDILKPRLDARVDQMIEQGLLDEIKALRQIAASDFSISTAASASQEDSDTETEDLDTDYTLGIYQIIGYKEFHNYLNSPVHAEEEFQRAVQKMKTATRRYAKRQVTWIRSQLLPAISATNEARQVEESRVISAYLLDATELEESWERNVREVAERITEDFLNGKELPDPLSLSETAEQVLNRMRGRPDSAARNIICSTCTVNKERPVMIAEGKEWNIHVRTRMHRRLLRKAHRSDVRNARTDASSKDESDGVAGALVDIDALFSK